jgi:hypothetical protein
LNLVTNGKILALHFFEELFFRLRQIRLDREEPVKDLGPILFNIFRPKFTDKT